MAIDLTKVPLLSHIQYLYGDIRDRIKEKYSKPEEGIPASDLAPGVIPDIGLIENGKAPIIMETASGNPIVITDGAAGLPMSECELTLLPRQSGSGDASPENVRPLIPWENVGMWTGGRNLLNVVAENAFVYSSYNHYTINNGNIIVDGSVLVAFKVKCNPLTTYTYSIKSTKKTYDLHLRVYGFENEPTSFVAQNARLNEQEKLYGTFTTQADDNWLLVGVYVAGNLGSEGLTISELQLEVGDTASFYVPYTTITPHPIDLSSITPAIYGCKINPITGEVWGTHVLWTKNTASMNNTADYPGWTNAGIRDIVGIGKNELVHTVLNIGDVLAVNTNNVNDIVYLPKTTYSLTQDEWIALAIDVQVALPLETPVLLATLTPQEIETLLGVNTIWSDADSIDIEYRADTELFINQNGVKDVQVNGTSVTTNGVANVPIASSSGLPKSDWRKL